MTGARKRETKHFNMFLLGLFVPIHLKKPAIICITTVAVCNTTG